MVAIRILIILTLAATVDGAWAQQQRLKLEGTWDGQMLTVNRIKQRDAGKDVRQLRVTGAVASVSAFSEIMQIGPVVLQWPRSPRQDFSSIKVGDVLQVDAIQSGNNRFTVMDFEHSTIDTSESIELIGALTGFSSDEEWTELQLAGIPARTPKRLFRNGRMGLQRLDDRRPDNQFTTVVGGVRTTIGGEFGVKLDADGDRDLDKENADERLDAEAQMQLEAYFEISDTIAAFAEVKAELSQRYDIPLQRRRNDFDVDRGELWVYFDQPLGLPAGIQIGRQNFAEAREWWWDADLDAIRIFVSYPNFKLEFAIAEEIAKETLNASHADAEDMDIRRLLARGSLRLGSNLVLDSFLLHQNDHSSSYDAGTVLAAHREDEDDANLTWIGARLSGDTHLFSILDAEYWFDFAGVFGEEQRYGFTELNNGDLLVDSVSKQDRSGTAFDLGGTITWPDANLGPFMDPAITLGYALGSGAEGSDGSFRSTGLNDNNGKFNGVDRFRYYGELSRPELENLRVVTLSFGLLFNDESSLELIYHDYQQDRRSTNHPLRIGQSANGNSVELGRELNLVLGLEEWEHIEIEGVVGVFDAGAAFDDHDAAWFAALKMDYNF